MLVRTLCLSLLVLPAAANADAVREGSGPRREALNALELTDFDAGLWGKLTEWNGGEALDAARTGGNVVLICTWASWYPSSVTQGLAVAQKAFAKYGGQGLLVVGVHHREGWAEAAVTAQGAGVKFPVAHDANHAFRDGLKVDQDPDFYLIDRSGHLRYADFATASVDQAVAELIAETREQAADLPRTLRERGDQARADAARNTTIRTDIELNTLPPVPPGYEEPAPEAYEKVRWPELTREEAQEMGLSNTNDRHISIPLNFAPDAWYPKEPAFDGRAYVIYLWHPDIPRSYSVLDRMDRLQAANVRDLVVIGALTPVANVDQSRQNQQDPETPEELAEKLDTFLKARHYAHTLAADFGATAILSAQGGNFGRGFPIPGAMVVSSDRTIRWIGSTYSPRFMGAVESVLLSDPGVRARREADRKFIQERK
jgi:hypothetical protein